MSLRPALVLLAVAGSLAAAQPPPRPTYETILRHGTIVDGTGGRLYQADIGIHNGHLARIGNLSNESALVEIDVAGLYVAPGFINIHSHASAAALATAENMLTQGVTTEIVNPDGGGPADIVQQLNDANSGGLALNVSAYIGFNSVWAEVMGAADRRAQQADEGGRGLVSAASIRGVGRLSKPRLQVGVLSTEPRRSSASSRPQRRGAQFLNHDRLTPESASARG
jgi:cytosine/adenosine deaminase-related metal-dependent hydrolase